MYKLLNNSLGIEPCAVLKDGKTNIPFDPANTDYQAFKADLAKGVELQDAEGAAMTAEQVSAFLATLP